MSTDGRYWINNIEGMAIKQGKSVLVASSENAIRGLLMHLLKIPKSESARPDGE